MHTLLRVQCNEDTIPCVKGLGSPPCSLRAQGTLPALPSTRGGVAPALMRTWHPNREIGRKPIGSMNCELCHPTSQDLISVRVVVYIPQSAISVQALPHQSMSSATSQPAISVRFVCCKPSTLHPDELRALPPHITPSDQPLRCVSSSSLA